MTPSYSEKSRKNSWNKTYPSSRGPWQTAEEWAGERSSFSHLPLSSSLILSPRLLFPLLSGAPTTTTLFSSLSKKVNLEGRPLVPTAKASGPRTVEKGPARKENQSKNECSELAGRKRSTLYASFMGSVVTPSLHSPPSCSSSEFWCL